MNIAEFEKRAIAAMASIPGAKKRRVEVGSKVVTATCMVDGKAYEMSFAFVGDVERDHAFAAVLRGIANTAPHDVRARQHRRGR